MRIYLLYILIFFLAHFQSIAVAQIGIDPSKTDPAYDLRKKQGVQKNIIILNSQPRNGVVNTFESRAAEDNNCFISKDSTYIAVPRNDDGYLLIDLPFSFNLYGS